MVPSNAPGTNQIRPETACSGMEETHLLEPRLARNATIKSPVILKAEARSHGNRLAYRT